MRKSIAWLIASVVIAISAWFVNEAWFQNAPLKKAQGWMPMGNFRYSEVGLDTRLSEEGLPVYCIRNNASGPNGLSYNLYFHKSYSGHRVRLRMQMKTKDVKGQAAFFLKVFDTANGSFLLGVDKMQDRSITGTTDWKDYDLVADVPYGANLLNYGAELRGQGICWFRVVKLEMVDNAVLATAKPCKIKESIAQQRDMMWNDWAKNTYEHIPGSPRYITIYPDFNDINSLLYSPGYKKIQRRRL